MIREYDDDGVERAVHRQGQFVNGAIDTVDVLEAGFGEKGGERFVAEAREEGIVASIHFTIVSHQWGENPRVITAAAE